MAATAPRRIPLRLLAAAALGAALAGVSVTVAVADPATDRVIVCESGIAAQGDVLTSSAIAVRADASTPVPEGCRAS